MHTQYIIIGAGISGTFLSYYLGKEGKSLIVIDDNDPNSPSRIAGGIINPVTGRRMAIVWKAEEIIPFAAQAYNEIGQTLDIHAISQKNLIDFFPNPHQRQVFLERITEDNQYLHAFPEQNKFNELINYDLGCGEIRHTYITHLEVLLPAWRNHLKENQKILEEKFDFIALSIANNEVHYKDIIAEKIIFCDGPAGANHSYFKDLPFAPNKGESLIVEIADLPDHHIYKKGFMLVPTHEQGIFWMGSNYQWTFNDADPSKEFYEQADRHLKAWLKVPYKIQEHHAALRPATLERRPFVGVHPHHKNIAILNGMGTKGCSLAPFFSRQLTDNLVYNTPIAAEADISRFSRILGNNFRF